MAAELYLRIIGIEPGHGGLEAICQVGSSTASLTTTLPQDFAEVKARRANGNLGDIRKNTFIGEKLVQTHGIS